MLHSPSAVPPDATALAVPAAEVALVAETDRAGALASEAPVGVTHAAAGLDSGNDRRCGLDPAAFDVLYADQLKPVFNYVRYCLGELDAEDVTAGVFERAWAHRADVDPARGAAEAWLWAIARHAVADRLRWRKHAPLTLAEDLPAPYDPRDVALARIDWAQALAAIRRLPEVDQEIIALRFGAGLSHRAIATLLDFSEANVAQRLRRALQRVRAELSSGEDPTA